MAWSSKRQIAAENVQVDLALAQAESLRRKLLQEQADAREAFMVVKRRQEVSWLKDAEKQKFSDLFVNLREDLETSSTQQLTRKNQKAHEAAVALLDQVRNLWGMIDVKLLTDENAGIMFDILHSSLPKYVQEYLSRSAPDGAHHALTVGVDVATGTQPKRIYSQYQGSYMGNETIYKHFPAFSKRMGDVTASLLKIKNEVFTTAIYPVIKPVPAGSSLSMLPLPLHDETAWSFIHRIEALWSEANSRKNSMEDTYFLEQTASVYVPDAVKMYSTFKLASPKIQEAARKILLQQLTLVEERLSLILDKTMEISLNDMQAQLNFLRYKTEGDVLYEPVQSKALMSVDANESY